jgi:hypothetical protein
VGKDIARGEQSGYVERSNWPEHVNVLHPGGLGAKMSERVAVASHDEVGSCGSGEGAKGAEQQRDTLVLRYASQVQDPDVFGAEAQIRSPFPAVHVGTGDHVDPGREHAGLGNAELAQELGRGGRDAHAAVRRPYDPTPQRPVERT